MAKKQAPQAPGAPAWMATFADMMTLLMAFFVLLLSLAEVDAMKYRAVAGSMKRALGVKVESIVDTMPDGELDEPKYEDKIKCTPSICEEIQTEAEKKATQAYKAIMDKLGGVAEDQQVFVQRQAEKILIRIKEHGVFKSGSARISDKFMPTIMLIRDTLAETEGGIRIAGHTDDIPIKNGRFPSNWALSSARAVAVVHKLLEDERIPIARVAAMGYGESRPIVPNDSDENRQKNRRVDIILTPLPDDIGAMKPESEVQGNGTIEATPGEAPEEGAEGAAPEDAEDAPSEDGDGE